MQAHPAYPGTPRACSCPRAGTRSTCQARAKLSTHTRTPRTAATLAMYLPQPSFSSLLESKKGLKAVQGQLGWERVDWLRCAVPYPTLPCAAQGSGPHPVSRPTMTNWQMSCTDSDWKRRTTSALRAQPAGQLG